MVQKFLVGLIVGIGFIGLVAIISFIAAIPTYFLWNWLMPELFAIKTITFLQAWGINVLTGLLFKSHSSK